MKEKKTIMASIRLTESQLIFLKQKYGSVQKAINFITKKETKPKNNVK